MPRRLAVLVSAAGLALTAVVIGAGPAAAAADGPNAHSQHGQCTSAASGKHLGWAEQTDGGRNIGGACPQQ